MHQGAGSNSKRCDGPCMPALSRAAADNIQGVRTRRDIQQQTGQHEKPEIMNAEHEPLIPLWLSKAGEEISPEARRCAASSPPASARTACRIRARPAHWEAASPRAASTPYKCEYREGNSQAHRAFQRGQSEW